MSSGGLYLAYDLVPMETEEGCALRFQILHRPRAGVPAALFLMKAANAFLTVMRLVELPVIFQKEIDRE